MHGNALWNMYTSILAVRRTAPQGDAILSRYEKVFIDGTAVRRGLPYYADVNVVVPPDALPTVRGAIMRSIDVGITWTVTTSLDVAGARDFHDSQQITVVRPPMPSDAPSSPTCHGGMQHELVRSYL